MGSVGSPTSPGKNAIKKQKTNKQTSDVTSGIISSNFYAT
jgi:hypothetical protein